MQLLIVGRAVVHGAVVEAGFVDGPRAGFAEAVVKIGGIGGAVVAPGQVALRLAMLVPPAVPAQQRREGVLKKPAVVKLPIEAQNRDGAHGRLGVIEGLPAAGAGEVGNEAIRRLLAQYLHGVGVGQVAVANGGQSGGEEGIPVEEHIAAKVQVPGAAHRGDDAAQVRLVDGIPAQRGFNSIENGRRRAGGGDGLLVGLALAIDNGLNLGQSAASSRIDAGRRREIH